MIWQVRDVCGALRVGRDGKELHRLLPQQDQGPQVELGNSGADSVGEGPHEVSDSILRDTEAGTRPIGIDHATAPPVLASIAIA